MSEELDAESKLRLNWKECCGTRPTGSALGPHGGCECECHRRPDLRAEIDRLQTIVDSQPKTAGTLMACHDVIRDLLAMRQGRPSAFVGSERLEQLAEECRELAEKARQV